jgi:hypothetical protein
MVVRRALLVGVAILGLPGAAAAWPAIQDVAGIHLCNSRPLQGPDGRWTCRSGGFVYEGSLVNVRRIPGPGWSGSEVPPSRRPPYGPYGDPWGPPGRAPSGYDELDPWLGSQPDR